MELTPHATARKHIPRVLTYIGLGIVFLQYLVFSEVSYVKWLAMPFLLAAIALTYLWGADTEKAWVKKVALVGILASVGLATYLLIRFCTG